MPANSDAADLLAVTALLRGLLGEARGRLAVTDAFTLAGFAQPSFQRSRLVTCAMRDLGWDRGRLRINGALRYVYARGSSLEREALLVVERGADDQLVVKRREP